MDAEYVAQTFQAKKKKKKPPPNAFFFYMQRLRDDLILSGKLSPNTSMAKMPPIAAPKWSVSPAASRASFPLRNDSFSKAMSAGEKAYYQNLAKTVKAEARGIPLVGEGGPASTETVVQVPNVPRVILDSRCVPLAVRRRRRGEESPRVRGINYFLPLFCLDSSRCSGRERGAKSATQANRSRQFSARKTYSLVFGGGGGGGEK